MRFRYAFVVPKTYDLLRIAAHFKTDLILIHVTHASSLWHGESSARQREQRAREKKYQRRWLWYRGTQPDSRSAATSCVLTEVRTPDVEVAGIDDTVLVAVGREISRRAERRAPKHIVSRIDGAVEIVVAIGRQMD